MKNALIGFVLFIVLVGGTIGLSYAFGWIGVHQTKTIYKAKENAKREVFEQTQSYVEGKRQAALKYYQEYQKLDDDQKKAMKSIIAHDFANFDEDKYLTGELYSFIHSCKYSN
jgi:hypothetical protein